MRGLLLVVSCLVLQGPARVLAEDVAAAVPSPTAGAAAAVPSVSAPHVPPRLGFEPEDFQGAPGVSDSVASAWALMVKATVGLALVLMIIYLVLGKGLARVAARQGMGRHLTVVDRVGLDHKRTLFLVDVDGTRMLVGTSEQAITITALPAEPQKPFSLQASSPETALAPATPADAPGGTPA